MGGLVEEITGASHEQAQGIEQINRVVVEMDKVVQHVASNAEESASASEEMNAQAEKMKEYVSDLVVLVGGNRAKSTMKGGDSPEIDRDHPQAAPSRRFERLSRAGKLRKQLPGTQAAGEDTDF